MTYKIDSRLKDYVIVPYDQDQISNVSTKFGEPYLDVEIVREDDGFICTFSNGIVAERWYQKNDLHKIDSDIFDMVMSLAEYGAQRLDKRYRNKLLSSNLIVRGQINITKVFAIRPFAIKKKEVHIYPAFLAK